MISIYPKCPEGRDAECRFLDGVRNTSSLHSPIVYNRKGEPVGGGANVSTRILHCTACNSNWMCKQTELEQMQGVPPKWESSKK